MSISSDEEEVFIPISTWSYPSFVKAFEYYGNQIDKATNLI